MMVDPNTDTIVRLGAALDYLSMAEQEICDKCRCKSEGWMLRARTLVEQVRRRVMVENGYSEDSDDGGSLLGTGTYCR